MAAGGLRFVLVVEHKDGLVVRVDQSLETVVERERAVAELVDDSLEEDDGGTEAGGLEEIHLQHISGGGASTAGCH